MRRGRGPCAPRGAARPGSPRAWRSRGEIDVASRPLAGRCRHRDARAAAAAHCDLLVDALERQQLERRVGQRVRARAGAARRRSRLPRRRRPRRHGAGSDVRVGEGRLALGHEVACSASSIAGIDRAAPRTRRASASRSRWRAARRRASPPRATARRSCCRRSRSGRTPSRSWPACADGRGSAARARWTGSRRSPGRSR